MISGYNAMATYRMNNKKKYIKMHAEEMKIIKESFDFYQSIRNIADARKCTLKSILERAQLDEGYGYKLLRGRDVKHTNNQDLIIAIAASMKIGLDATQELRRLYGLPLLDVYAKNSARQGIICRGLINRVGVDGINRELYEQGLEILRTTKRKPSIEKGEQKMTKNINKKIIRFAGHRKPNRIKRIIDYHWQAEPYGLYEPDVAITIEVMIELENTEIHIIKIYWNTEESFYDIYRVPTIEWSEDVRKSLWKGESFNNDEMQASIEDLDEDWISYKDEIDISRQKLLEVIAEVMDVVDDTRNYEYRISDGIREGTKHAVEMYYRYNPFDNDYVGKEVYLQVSQTEKGYRYTASKESYYLLYHLGKAGYSAWYGQEKTEEYFIDINDITKLTGDEQECFREKFILLEQRLKHAN